MGGFNGNGKGWGEDRNGKGRNRGQRRLFLERSLESLEDRRMLDGSGVASNFGDYYMFQDQKQALLRSGSELVIQFEPGKRDTASISLVMPGGYLTGFTKIHNLGDNGVVYRRPEIAGMSASDQVTNLVQLSNQIRQIAGVQGATPAFVNAQTGGSLYVLNELYVGLKDGVDPEAFFSVNSQVQSWTKIKGSKNEFVVALKVNAGMETLQYAATLAQNSMVSYTEPNSWIIRTKAAAPNDPLLNLQWQNINTGQTGGTAGADVNALGAWNRGVTGTGVVVAVLDDGVQLTHPDLAANIFINTNEIPNDGIDNDNNGFIDDVNGWDFADNDNNPNPRLVDDAHGTTVAGLAAAVGNNGIGVAGVAYNSQILAVRLPFNGEPTTATAFIEGVYYAAGLGTNGNRLWRGADVLNASYGQTGGPITAEANAWLAAFQNGRNGLGTLNFASTGNNGGSSVSWPAAYTGVIAIGASDFNDTRSTFSQYGPELDLMAPSGPGNKPSAGSPGAYPLTTDLVGNAGYNSDLGGLPEHPTTQVSVDYSTFSGTSASSPIAAGVGALAVAANPTATATEITSALLSTADKIGGVVYDNNGFNIEYGYGRINAGKAVALLQQFTIITSTPANNATVTASPASLILTFSEPVDPTSLNPADLVFSNLPAGTTVTVGTPTAINGGLQVSFPLTFNASPTTKINGQFGYRVPADSIRSANGRFIAAYSGNFTLNDQSGPRVTSLSTESRRIIATFDEPMRASTINKTSFLLYRSDTQFGTPTLITLANDPRWSVSYDLSTGRAVMDLTDMPQSLLPDGYYKVVLKDTIRDVAGNTLDGEFNGSFPSGNGVEGSDFNFDLGLRIITAPRIVQLSLAPTSDSGTKSDQNTNVPTPNFIGRVQADFPATVFGLPVAAGFNYPDGTFPIQIGPGGIGWTGNADIVTTTDREGMFQLSYAQGTKPPLPDGFYRVRVIAVGQPVQGSPVLSGKATQQELSFRIDLTNPSVQSSTIANSNNGFVSALTSITLNIVDPVLPASGIFAVPTGFNIPTLQVDTATNISNYSLIDVGADGILGTSDDIDASGFIASIVYTNTSNRQTTADPYTATVSITFTPGVPKAKYVFSTTTRITDSAGNSLVPFTTTIDVNPVPVYIKNFSMGNTTVVNNQAVFLETGGPRALFELNDPLQPSASKAAATAPDTFVVDFSSTLDPTSINPNSVQLFRSANSSAASPDGDFRFFGMAGDTGVGYTQVPGLTITLVDSVPGCSPGDPGYRNRLLVQLPAGLTLDADNYRIILPNSGSTAIRDIFGLQLDGEFLGNPVAGTDVYAGDPALPYRNMVSQYETLMPTGQYRNGLSGDGVEGSAFVTGFTVVPYGNFVFTRADYNDDPFFVGDDPDGSFAKPYATLLPEAVANSTNRGDLNSQLNFGINFNTAYDRNGNGRFDASAFFAAMVKSGAVVYNPITQQYEPGTPNAPVAIVALESNAAFNPVSGVVERRSFVIQTPKGTLTEGSGSVPAMTTLSFDPGTAVKFSNTNLYVQMQGSAIQTRGLSAQGKQVIFTSLADDTVGDDANGDGVDTTPRAGDWGGLVLRNFDDISNGRAANPFLFPVNGALGLSGADDVMSAVNLTNIRYAGGPVPQTIGPRYNALTLFNARPSVSNSAVTDTGGTGSAQAAIGADFDSFREDSNARGPLIRRTTLAGNSLNGVWLMPNVDGFARPTNAMFYPNNPTTAGGSLNYTVDDPLPVVTTSQVDVGVRYNYNINAASTTSAITNRLYIQPGMMFKNARGAWINVDTAGASVNFGDRTYIDQFDRNPNFGPTDSTFRPNTSGDARIVFTSLYDDLASTFFFDPKTGTRTTIVPAMDSDNGGSYLQPTPTSVDPLARWGAINLVSGSIGVIDEIQLQYAGGIINLQDGTLPSLNALNFTSFGGTGFGGYVSVTNNDFYYNQDAPMAVDPNVLFAGDASRPLVSGNPFFRGNVMQGNGIDGLAVLANVAYTPTGPVEVSVNFGGSGTYSNLDVNSVWDDTDITYVVRGSIVLGGYSGFFGNTKPAPNFTTLTAEQTPFITLTVQSNLPDTLLANGTRIARPGETMLVKLLNDPNNAAMQPGGTANGQPNDTNATFAGAGWVVGRDNGIDPTADPTLDAGWGSQIRFLGLNSNETTGQSRVPVLVTSLRDTTVGTTVRGVQMNNILSAGRYPGLNPTTPLPGDGGVLYFGSLMLTDYNLWDPRGGSLIDTTDFKYLTRIEFVGGNVSDMVSITADTAIDINDNPLYQKLGLNMNAIAPGIQVPFLTQFNSANAMTMSNSSLDSFSQVGVVVHPGNDLLVRNYSLGGVVQRVGGLKGQGTVLYSVNNTFSNMPGGIRALAETLDNTSAQNPTTVMALNNTFYNAGIGLYTEAPAFNGANSRSHVYAIAMNNIFANNATFAIQTVGMNLGNSMAYGQYNLYFQNGGGNSTPGFFEVTPIIGNPLFRNAATGDFALLPGSAAIDVARSELGPLAMGNALAPISTQVLTGTTGGIRNQSGRISPNGAFGSFLPGDIIALPGSPVYNYVSQFVPNLTGTPGSYRGAASNPATWAFTPMAGERDQVGFLRQDDPTRPNIGFGSRPFFDVGAFEYRQLFSPKVTAVSAIIPGSALPVNIYVPLGIGGTNQSPTSITFSLDSRLDPLSVNSATVILQAAGGDGIFANANSVADRTINLSGKLVYNVATKTITVNLGASNLNLTNDLYRIILVGEGASVIRDQLGNPLDGENLDSNGQQLPLPSGNGIPGGNFQMTFSVDTNAPNIVAGSLRITPATDTGQPGDQITRVNPPQFTGSVFDVPPPQNPLLGQSVSVSISSLGNGVYDIPNAGTGTTDAQGIFLVRPTRPLPQTQFNVGPDGILGTADDSGYSVARFVATDQSGNVSNINDRNALLRFVVDTQGPQVTSASPAPFSQINPINNVQPITVGINENLDPASVNVNTIRVVRSGGDGVFNNGNDVVMTVDPASIAISYLKIDAQGSVNLSFNVTGAFPNDLYRVTLVGSGTTGITDRAGNLLNGQFSGQFPSGTTNGSGDFVMYYTILDPARFLTRYVGSSTFPTGALGSRTNPYPTITAAMTAAQIGDTIAVLPGVYNENIVMKSLVQLVSASSASTNTTLFPGDAKETVIRPAFGATNVVTVTANGLLSSPIAPTRISGMTIAASLLGSPTSGTIDPASIGISVTNSLMTIDRVYVMNAGTGIRVATSGNSALTPTIANSVIVGNTNGVVITDGGATESLAAPVRLTNNTIAFNDNGVVVNVASDSPVDFVQIINSIFSGNATLTSPRAGYAVRSTTLDRVTLRFNNFFNNGASPTNYSDDTLNIGNGFDPSALNFGRDALGNVPGDPAFVFPIDPRPSADGPFKFFTDANYSIKVNSVGIDAALNSSAPTLDFLYRTRVTIPGRGYPGTGPADMGAFEYNGTPTNPSRPIVVPTSTSTGTGTGGSGTGGSGNTGSGTGGGTITPTPAPKPTPKVVVRPAPKPRVRPTPKPAPKPRIVKPKVTVPRVTNRVAVKRVAG